jgi:hypothetical protein
VQTTTLYDQDFYAWTQQQVKLLRSGNLQALDVENLIEEIESLGKQQRQELRNRLGELLGHREQRREITLLLKENPSLKPCLPEALEIGYEKGLDLVLKETPIPMSTLPHICPFSDVEIFEAPIELETE